MTTTPTLDGIDKALSHLNYRNEASAKYRLVMTLRHYYVSEKSPASLKTIPVDAVIQKIWGIDNEPQAVRAKLKNFNSIKSSVNSDLNRLYAKGLNPEGVTIGPSNTFVISDQAKDALLSSIAGAVSLEDQPAATSIQQVTRVLESVKEMLAQLQAASTRAGQSVQPGMEEVFEQLSQSLALYRSMRQTPASVHAAAESDPDPVTTASNVLTQAGDPSDHRPSMSAEDRASQLRTAPVKVSADAEGSPSVNAAGLKQADADSIAMAPESCAPEQGAGEQKPVPGMEEAVDCHAASPNEPIPAEATLAAHETLADRTDRTSIVPNEDSERLEVINIEADCDEVLEVDEVDVIDEDVHLPVQSQEDLDEKSGDPAEGQAPVGESEPDGAQIGMPLGNAGFDTDNEISEAERKRLLSERFDGYLGAMERYYNQYFNIPAGEYLIGAPRPQQDECPQRKLDLPSYFIGKFPVTNALFEVFVERTGYQTSAERCGYGTVYHGRFHRRTDKATGQATSVWHATTRKEVVPGACWHQPTGPGSSLHSKRKHPVVQLSYRDAMAFAAWIGKRLPTEAEWEAAARTRFGYPYSWGKQWQADCCSIEESYLSDTSPVDQYPHAVNVLSIADTLGNVMEWTADEFVLPHMRTASMTYRVAKGGSYISDRSLRLWSRFRFAADFSCNLLGFRCVAD